VDRPHGPCRVTSLALSTSGLGNPGAGCSCATAATDGSIKIWVARYGRLGQYSNACPLTCFSAIFNFYCITGALSHRFHCDCGCYVERIMVYIRWCHKSTTMNTTLRTGKDSHVGIAAIAFQLDCTGRVHSHSSTERLLLMPLSSVSTVLCLLWPARIWSLCGILPGKSQCPLYAIP
jgi:hypothetical protein